MHRLTKQVLTQVERITKRATFSFTEAFVGGAGFDRHQNHFGKEAQETCRAADAVLFGSVGGPVSEQHLPKWKDCEKNSILGMRKTFGFGTNVRPARVYPGLEEISPLKSEVLRRGVDMIIVRELLGGVYFGEHWTSPDSKVARDVMNYDWDLIARPMRFAFEAARKRKGCVTCVDKANVLDCSRLWRRVAESVAKEYSDVKLDFMLVDNCAMQLIKDPTYFDVIVTENLFGDILSDAASCLPGSLGLMPSASLGSGKLHMYEPSGGSAPDIAGKGVANPIAQILSAAMMLRFSFGMEQDAKLIETAVDQVLVAGHRTRDLIPKDSSRKVVGTVEMGDLIAKEMEICWKKGM